MAEEKLSHRCLTATPSTSSSSPASSKTSETVPKKTRTRARKMDNTVLLRKAIRTSYSMKKVKHREAMANLTEDDQSESSESESGDDVDESEDSSLSTSSSSTSSPPKVLLKNHQSLKIPESYRSKLNSDDSTIKLLQSVTDKLENLLKNSAISEPSSFQSSGSPPRPLPRTTKKPSPCREDGGSRSKCQSAEVSPNALYPISLPILYLQSSSVSLKRQEATSYLLSRRRKILAARKKQCDDASPEPDEELMANADVLQEGYQKVEMQLETLLEDDVEGPKSEANVEN